MKITQVTFVAKNPKCLSIKPKRYLIDTTDSIKALEVATKLLNKEKHTKRYRSLTPILIDVHDA